MSECDVSSYQMADLTEDFPCHRCVAESDLATVRVKGVADALSKYADNPKVEGKGIKAHFHLSDSGLLNITGIEAVFERTISVEEQEEEERKKEDAEKAAKGEGSGDGDEKKDGEGGWGNLGDTISNFFNKGKQ